MWLYSANIVTKMSWTDFVLLDWLIEVAIWLYMQKNAVFVYLQKRCSMFLKTVPWTTQCVTQDWPVKQLIQALPAVSVFAKCACLFTTFKHARDYLHFHGWNALFLDVLLNRERRKVGKTLNCWIIPWGRHRLAPRFASQYSALFSRRRPKNWDSMYSM